MKEHLHDDVDILHAKADLFLFTYPRDKKIADPITGYILTKQEAVLALMVVGIVV